MIKKAVLRYSFFFLFLTTQSALSQLAEAEHNKQSINDQSPDLNTSGGPHSYRNSDNTRRVSVTKCKEYIGEEDEDDLNTKQISTNIYVGTKNGKNSEENTEITTQTETKTEMVMDNFEEITDSKNILKDASYVTENVTKYSKNEEQTNRENMKTSNMTLNLEEEPEDVVLQVVGGESANIAEFPHMAAIGWKNSNDSYSFDCGGSLISPKFVLTAAHCTYSHVADDPIPAVVKLGAHFITGSMYFKANPIQVAIKAILKHPEYTRKKHYNDIALLELEVEVKFVYNIQPACLWSSGDLSSHSTAIATGWGLVDSYSGKRPDTLQKVSLHLFSNEKCNNSLENLVNKKWDKGFIDSQLCAGETTGGKDTCQGDSGSPLQVPMLGYPGRYYLIGITSFGPRICAQLPAVYTRVSSYLDWIENKVWPDEYKEWSNKVND